MALLQFPREIIEEIFDNVGSSFFREDLKRLTVSKQWFESALPAAFKSLELSQESLQAMVSAWEIRKSFPAVKHLESLELNLVGFKPPAPPPGLPRGPQLFPDDVDDGFVAVNRTFIIRWEQGLAQNLARLAIIAQDSPKLRKLHICAIHAPPPSPMSRPDEYLPLRGIKPLISACNLRVLVLDLNVNLTMSQQERRDRCHICPAIGALLDTLEILHIRTRTICPDALKPRDADRTLRLREVVVNLSHIESHLIARFSSSHSLRCYSPGTDLPSLKSEMCEQAKALASLMPSPKSLKIITHSIPSLEIESLDVLSGRIGILEGGMEWNANGKAKDDSGADTEF